MSDTRAITNRKIAEMLGHKVHDYNDEPMWCDRIRDWLFEDWMEGGSEWDVMPIPDYLRSADAALSLVEGYFKLETYRGDNDETLWRARFGFNDRPFATGTTPAEAISKTFMLDVEYQRAWDARYTRAHKGKGE